MQRHFITRVVVPLDLLLAEESAPDEDPPVDELDWAFDDPELTRELHAIKAYDVSIAAVIGCLLSVVTAIALFA